MRQLPAGKEASAKETAQKREEMPAGRLARKAFVFSLDMLIAVFVVILLLTAAHTKVMTSESDRMSPAQLTASGADITAILEERGVLQTLDHRVIASEMNDLLPPNQNMSMVIEVDKGPTVYVGQKTDKNVFLGSGKRFFTINDASSMKYAYARYSIWAR